MGSNHMHKILRDKMKREETKRGERTVTMGVMEKFDEQLKQRRKQLMDKVTQIPESMWGIKSEENKVEIPSTIKPALKSKNQWLVIISGEDFEVGEWVMSKAERPNFKRNIFGKMVPGEMTLELRDPIGDKSVSDKLYKTMRGNNKLNITIKLLDPNCDIIETWDLADCKLLNLHFGPLDYDSNNPVMIKMVVKPKRVELLD